jgi:hypothetical protein
MLGNYWRITWRHIFRHKSYTLLNLLGLAAAIASSIIIALYAKNELTYDAHHQQADRIHLVIKQRNTDGGLQQLDDTWLPLMDMMLARYPEISNGVRVFAMTDSWVEANGKKFSETVVYADPSLFDVFSFPLASGDSATALEGRDTIVLSQEMARKYFGTEDPMDRILTVGFGNVYQVSGVLAEVPANSTLRPDFILPFESFSFPEEWGAGGGEWDTSFLRRI